MSKKFDINTFDPQKNYIIEASAGTGKTYSIVQMVRKICDSGVPLQNLLVVTFTEKAAEELKNRIREEGLPVDEEGTSIGTIHSFCENIIKEFPVSSGLPSGMEVIDESEAEDFAKSYLRRKEFRPFIKSYIEKFPDDIGFEKKLVKKLAVFAKSYYLNADFKEDPSVVSLDRISGYMSALIGCYLRGEDLENERTGTLKGWMDTLRQSADPKLVTLPDHLDPKTFNFKGNTYRSNSFKSATAAENNIFEEIKKIKDYLKTGDKVSIDVLSLFLEENAEDFYKAWQEEKKKRGVQTFNDMIRNVREKVMEKNSLLLPKLRERYKVAIIDEFQDTNQKQWDIFRSTFLCENHSIIVVGDPKQSIYAFQGTDIFVYENAKKDILTGGGVQCVLSTNYRASKSMVEETNHFFDNNIALDTAFTPSDCGFDRLKFTFDGEELPAFWIQAQFSRPEDEKPEETESEEEDEDEIGTDEDIPEYAYLICQTIADCCSRGADGKTRLQLFDKDGKQRNVYFSDFCMLFRTRSEVPSYVKALEKFMIPYVRYKDDSLFTGKECADWIAILEAVATPDFSGRNRRAFRKALYTSFFGYTLEEISDEVFDRDSTREFNLFQKWKTAARDGRWEDLINGILTESSLISVLQSLTYLKTLGLYKQIGDFCISTLGKCCSLDALILKLKKLMDKDAIGEGEDVNKTSVSTDFKAVRLMTIHAAKGLEFPIVISVAGFKRKPPNVYSYSYHDDNNRQKLLLHDDEAGKNKADDERISEWKRLFYVAYTRAKYVLILPLYDRWGDPFIENSIRSYMANYPDGYRRLLDNGKDDETVKAEIQTIIASLSSKSAVSPLDITNQEKAMKDLISQRKKLTSRKHAYSSLSHQKPKAEEVGETGLIVNEEEDSEEEGLSGYDLSTKPVGCSYNGTKDPLELSPDYPRGAGLGNALHEILELCDYTVDPDNDETRKLIRDCFIRQKFRHPKQKWIDNTSELLKNIFGAVLPEIKGNAPTGNSFRLSDISMENRKNEVEFNYNRENEFLNDYFNGFIDLITKRNDTFAVLDWKTDRLLDDFDSYSDGEILKKHIDKVYAIQRVLYSYTLIKWLENFYPDKTDGEIFKEHFGGVYYVCVRGCREGTGNGIYAQTWESFQELEDAYEKILKERVDGK